MIYKFILLWGEKINKMRKKEYLSYKKNLNRRSKIFRKLYLKSQENSWKIICKKEISRINCIIKDLNLTYKEIKKL